MDYQGFARHVFNTIVFNENGEYKEGMKEFWGPRGYTDDFATQVKAKADSRILPWYQRKGRDEERARFIKEGPVTIGMTIEPQSDASKAFTTEIEVSPELLWDLWEEEDARTTRAAIYASTHDAYGHAIPVDNAHRRGWMFIGRDE